MLSRTFARSALKFSPRRLFSGDHHAEHAKEVANWTKYTYGKVTA